MALPALREAYEVLEAAPAPPRIDTTHREDFRERIMRIEKGFAAAVAAWQSQLVSIRAPLKQSFEEFFALSPNKAEALSGLRELIADIEAGSIIREDLLKKHEARFQEDERLIARTSMEDARFFRKSARRFLELQRSEYMARVNFQEFLFVLLYDHDPDAQRIGPAYNDADGLLAALKEPAN